MPFLPGTYVKIPLGLLSETTIAQLNRDSSIFFAASKTVSVGDTVSNLTKNPQYNKERELKGLICQLKPPKTRDITYFECSERTVDSEGLKTRSLSASMKVLGPANQTKEKTVSTHLEYLT